MTVLFVDRPSCILRRQLATSSNTLLGTFLMKSSWRRSNATSYNDLESPASPSDAAKMTGTTNDVGDCVPEARFHAAIEQVADLSIPTGFLPITVNGKPTGFCLPARPQPDISKVYPSHVRPSPKPSMVRRKAAGRYQTIARPTFGLRLEMILVSRRELGFHLFTSPVYRLPKNDPWTCGIHHSR